MIKKTANYLLTLTVLATCAGFLVSGCSSGKSKSQEKYREVRTLLVHGNPLNLIKGTTTNTISPLTVRNHAKLRDFNLARLDHFSERTVDATRILEARTGDIEQDNQTTFDPDFNNLSRFQFEQFGQGWLYRSSQLNLSLQFANIDGRLELNRIYLAPDKPIEVKVLHYSLKNDLSAFSILSQIEDQYGPILVAMTFTKNNAPAGNFSVSLSKLYSYIMGYGVPTRWEDKIPLHLCGNQFAGSSLSSSARSVRAGALAWSQNPSIFGSIPYSVKTLSSFPPFSDLNQSCLYLLEDYILEEEVEGNQLIGTLGVALPTVDATKSRILASSVFIIDETIKKFAGPSLENYRTLLRVTTAHEVGHFIGLGHEFRKNSQGQSLFPSIMSYDRSVSGITEHDRQAVRELYR